MKVAPKLLQAIGLALLLPCADPGNAQTRPAPAKHAVHQDSAKTKKRYTVVAPKPDSLQQKKATPSPYYCPPCGRG